MTPENPSLKWPSGKKLTEFTIIFDEDKPPIGPIPCLPFQPSRIDSTGGLTIVLDEEEEDPGSGKPENPAPPSP